MVVIGVTGGIASGKSLVAQQLGQFGAEVLEADRIGHAVLQDPEVRAALGARWGTGILDAAGEIRRSVVAEKVFAPPPDGPRELAFLEQWTHPRIAARLGNTLRVLSQQGDVPVVVLDAAVLLQSRLGCVLRHHHLCRCRFCDARCPRTATRMERRAVACPGSGAAGTRAATRSRRCGVGQLGDA